MGSFECKCVWICNILILKTLASFNNCWQNVCKFQFDAVLQHFKVEHGSLEKFQFNSSMKTSLHLYDVVFPNTMQHSNAVLSKSHKVKSVLALLLWSSEYICMVHQNSTQVNMNSVIDPTIIYSSNRHLPSFKTVELT